MVYRIGYVLQSAAPTGEPLVSQGGVSSWPRSAFLRFGVGEAGVCGLRQKLISPETSTRVQASQRTSARTICMGEYFLLEHTI